MREGLNEKYWGVCLNCKFFFKKTKIIDAHCKRDYDTPTHGTIACRGFVKKKSNKK